MRALVSVRALCGAAVVLLTGLIRVISQLSSTRRSLAFAKALSDRIVAGDVIVVDSFGLEAPKTKLMAKALKELGIERSACIVQKDVDETVVLASRNLPRISYETAQAIDVYTVVASKKIVCDKAGFDALLARIAK